MFVFDRFFTMKMKLKLIKNQFSPVRNVMYS